MHPLSKPVAKWHTQPTTQKQLRKFSSAGYAIDFMLLCLPNAMTSVTLGGLVMEGKFTHSSTRF